MSNFIKVLCFGLAFGLWLTDSAYPNLTKQDIEEIRKIVKEEIHYVNIRIDDINRRIDDLDRKLSTRIDDLDTKFSTRIDDLDSKFTTRTEDLKGLLYVILAGMFALVGFVIWDRRTALAPAVRKAKELEEEEEKIKKALREYAYQEPKLATALRSVGLM